MFKQSNLIQYSAKSLFWGVFKVKSKKLVRGTFEAYLNTPPQKKPHIVC